jgi:hypothetical protein
MLFISSAQQDENSDTDGPGVGGVGTPSTAKITLNDAGCKQILIYLAQVGGPILSPSAR